MSDKDKELMNAIAEGLTKLSEFQKGYVLGMMESGASDKDKMAQAEQCKDAQGQPD